MVDGADGRRPSCRDRPRRTGRLDGLVRHDRDHPLTLTVEQAGKVLGIGRSTAYELVRSGDLKAIRLRRRIVVPVAHLAEPLGVVPRRRA